MPVFVKCACGQMLTCPEGFEGRQVKCPTCGALQRVPQKAQAAGAHVQPPAPPAMKKCQFCNELISATLSRCPRCGESLGPAPCRHCGTMCQPGTTNCPKCGARLGAGPERQGPEAPPVTAPSGEASTPWEKEGPLFSRLIDTCKAVMFSPGSFFGRMPISEGITKPMIYGIILSAVGIVFAQVYQILWNVLFGAVAVGAGAGGGRDMAMQTGINMVMSIITIVFSPLWAVIGLFIQSAILHLCLLLVGGATNGFEATFRVVCYSQSPAVCSVIPFVGSPVGGVWTIVDLIIGFSKAHQISGMRAAVAVLLPIVICCTCVAFFFGSIILLAIGAGAAGG
jgi:hypothetical protein